jgi:glycosyltransferase involved in cell wall biosynthesis
LKILLVGPLLPPVHGQSLAFTRFYESIDDNSKILINTNLEDKTKFGKILNTGKTLLSIAFKSLFYKYDVVYFTCSRSFLGSIKDVLLINLVSLKKVKIINHLHGSDFNEFLHSSPKWYQNILFGSYKKIDTSIVLLDTMKNQFKDIESMNVEVISNFYDKDLDKKLVDKSSDRIKLVYLSNIMSSKGVFELINAFDELSKKYDNVYLNIAGGYMADEYMSMEEVKTKFTLKVKKNSRIKYIGKVFGEQKIKLLQSSDIFVLPSYYKSEAFPISIIEAMACSNAIITTNYKYLPEVVNDKNGILVEPKSVESLKRGLESLLNNLDKIKKIQIHNKYEAQRKYSLDNYLNNLNKLVLG